MTVAHEGGVNFTDYVRYVCMLCIYVYMHTDEYIICIYTWIHICYIYMHTHISYIYMNTQTRYKHMNTYMNTYTKGHLQTAVFDRNPPL